MAKTIREISDAWKEEKRPYVKQSTYAAYMLILKNHILPYFGNSEDVKESMIQSFVLKQIDAGLSVKSIKDIIIVLKMVMKYGVKNGLVNYYEWDIKYPTETNHKNIEVLSVANHKKILKYIQNNFTFRNFGIYICLCTGLRIGEVCGLKWSDIDIALGTISVQRTVERIYFADEGERGTEVIINTPKTKNSFREIPMSRELISLARPLKKIVNTGILKNFKSARLLNKKLL